ncbi:MAG: hypothetical protein HOP14_07785 [Acidobacteria bacterium]|nr:hypothetical protein [Acidobacteriota bacterium]
MQTAGRRWTLRPVTRQAATLVQTGRQTTTLRQRVRQWTAGAALLTLIACGGSSPSSPSANPTPSPAPTPTPSAAPTLIFQGGGLLPSRTLLSTPFTTTATGTIGASVDWTFANSDLDLFLVRGTDPCTLDQFNNRQCPFLGAAESLTTKPETLSVPNLAAGAYTVYVANFADVQESVSLQITLTTTSGVSASGTTASAAAVSSAVAPSAPRGSAGKAHLTASATSVR